MTPQCGAKLHITASLGLELVAKSARYKDIFAIRNNPSVPTVTTMVKI